MTSHSPPNSAGVPSHPPLFTTLPRHSNSDILKSRAQQPSHGPSLVLIYLSFSYRKYKKYTMHRKPDRSLVSLAVTGVHPDVYHFRISTICLNIYSTHTDGHTTDVHLVSIFLISNPSLVFPIPLSPVHFFDLFAELMGPFLSFDFRLSCLELPVCAVFWFLFILSFTFSHWFSAACFLLFSLHTL